MAHYVASINVFEHHDGPARASVKVFRVFEFGAAPRRPVWERQVTLEAPGVWQPRQWLVGVLEELLETTAAG